MQRVQSPSHVPVVQQVVHRPRVQSHHLQIIGARVQTHRHLVTLRRPAEAQVRNARGDLHVRRKVPLVGVRTVIFVAGTRPVVRHVDVVPAGRHAHVVRVVPAHVLARHHLVQCLVVNEYQHRFIRRRTIAQHEGPVAAVAGRDALFPVVDVVRRSIRGEIRREVVHQAIRPRGDVVIPQLLVLPVVDPARMAAAGVPARLRVLRVAPLDRYLAHIGVAAGVIDHIAAGIVEARQAVQQQVLAVGGQRAPGRVPGDGAPPARLAGRVRHPSHGCVIRCVNVRSAFGRLRLR